LKLLFDHNISPRVARAINELIKDEGSLAIPLRDKFSADATDLEWVSQLGAEGGWGVVSGDRNIARNRAEKAAWMQTDLVGFFLEPALASLNPREQTSRLILWLPLIEQQLDLIGGPALFALPIRSTSRMRQL
jgi:hypothetical protein